MKIKMLKTAAGPDGVLAAGKDYDVELELGQQLVMADAAEWLEKPPAPKKAAPKVEAAAAEPVAETAEAKPRRRGRPRKKAD